MHTQSTALTPTLHRYAHSHIHGHKCTRVYLIHIDLALQGFLVNERSVRWKIVLAG